MLQCVAVLCCSACVEVQQGLSEEVISLVCCVLQCVAVCCSVLECVVVCCRVVLQCVCRDTTIAERQGHLAECCSVLQCVAVLQCVVCYSVLQCCVAVNVSRNNNG